MPVDHLSASSISTYTRCPKQWKFHYLDKIEPESTSVHLVFGSAAHAAIEDYIVDGKLMTSSFADVWSTELSQRGDVNYYGDDQQHYEQLGQKMFGSKSVQYTMKNISVYRTDDKPMVEHFLEFQITGVPVPIIGYVDLVESDKVPIDFKTSSRKWRKGQEYEGWQPPLYVFGLQQTGFQCQDQFRYYVLVKNYPFDVQRIEFDVSDRWINRALSQVRHVWNGIRNGVIITRSVKDERASIQASCKTFGKYVVYD